MKQISTVCLLLLFSTSYAFSQLSGTVKDAQTAEAIPFVGLQAFSSLDTIVATTTQTDASGKYQFRALSGQKYIVKAKAFGYLPFRAIVDITGEKTVLDIALVAETKTTATTEITGKKNPITRSADKTEVNVDGTAAYNGLSALEILRRVPGVQIDNNGAISLMGKASVQIMIDGRIMNLSAAELSSLLKGMPSAQLKKIELMTQPGAKYDAEGNAGIIQIITKKGAKESFRLGVNITQGQGFYPKHNSSLYASYGNKTITLGTNYSYVENLNRDVNDEIRNFIKPEGTTTQGYVQEYKNPEFGHTLKNDFSVTLGKGHSVSGEYLLSRNVKVSKGGTTSYLIDPDGTYTPSRTTDYSPDATWSHQMDVRYDWKPDSSKHHLVIATDYIILNQITKQNFGITYGNVAPLNEKRFTQSIMYNPIGTGLFIPRLDYTYSFSDSLKIEAGAKANILDLSNDVARTNSYLRNGNTTDSLSPSRYSYKEQVLAAYVSMEWKRGKYGLSTGLRGENWHADGLQKVNGAGFVRNQFQLFPTVALSYQASPATQWLLKLNRRIDRPSYNMLNPYTFLMDAYTRWKGNPALLPSLSNNAELGVNFLYGLAGVNLSVSKTTNPVIEYAAAVEADTNFKTALQPQNLKTFTNVNLNGYFSPDITKWWHVDLFAMVYNNKYSGQYFGAEASNAAWAFLGNIDQRFTLSKTWQADVQFQYIGPSVFGILQVKKLVMLSLGIQKSFMDEQLSLRLQGQNILNSFYYGTATNTPNLKDSGAYRWDNQIISFSLTWKLGQLKAKLPVAEGDGRLGKSLGR